MFTLMPFSRNILAHWCLALQSKFCAFYHQASSYLATCLFGPYFGWFILHLTCIKSASKWSEEGWEHGLETELPSLLAVGCLSIVGQLVHPPHVLLLLLVLLKGEEEKKLTTSPLFYCLKLGAKPVGEQAQVFPHPSLT